MIARSTPWGTIQFGDAFYRLTELEQRAVIAHEEGHIHHRHALKRLWWLASFQWKGFFKRCEAQELEADRYAVERGHAAGLISFLFRQGLHVKSDGYPTHRQRIEAIHVR
jgi:Zn-dependent protease with chaperone function